MGGPFRSSSQVFADPFHPRNPWFPFPFLGLPQQTEIARAIAVGCHIGAGAGRTGDVDPCCRPGRRQRGGLLQGVIRACPGEDNPIAFWAI
jgi:hypothetical protein